MKNSILVLAFLGVVTSGLAQVPGQPKFQGLPNFSSTNWITPGPYPWNKSHEETGPNAPAGDPQGISAKSDDLRNRKGSSSQLYITVPNDFDFSGNEPLPHQIRFYWKTDAAPLDQMSFMVNDSTQRTILGQVGYYEETLTIPPVTNSPTITLKWQFSKMSLINAGVNSGYLDAVKWTCIYNPGDPDFGVLRENDPGYVVKWNTNYSGYTLQCSTNLIS